MIFCYIIIYIAVVLAAAGQIMLKLGAEAGGINLGIIRLNIWVVLGLGAMVISMLLSVRALSVIPLRNLSFILPTVYVLVPLFSWVFFKERFGKRTIIGIIILVVGIMLFNIPMKVIF
jgi:drug/metabolite transporter (DMT)-like permease